MGETGEEKKKHKDIKCSRSSSLVTHAFSDSLYAWAKIRFSEHLFV